MTEALLDVRHLPKHAAYAQLDRQIRDALAGIDDPIAAMATISCALYQGFGFLWAGFYRVVERDRLLRVGPYQGSLGCLEIRFGSGVCGTAAARLETVIVPDVSAFPGHIACDARSRSEIVVPAFGREGDLLAVLDIDSEQLDAFGEVDVKSLERLVGGFASGW